MNNEAGFNTVSYGNNDVSRHIQIFAEIFERYTQRGELRGIQIGEQRSKLILQKQLEKRFGVLPSWVVSRLEQATSQQLEDWSLQIFDASCLEDIFNKF